MLCLQHDVKHSQGCSSKFTPEFKVVTGVRAGSTFKDANCIIAWQTPKLEFLKSAKESRRRIHVEKDVHVG